jgi:hypothetical protein
MKYFEQKDVQQIIKQIITRGSSSCWSSLVFIAAMLRGKKFAVSKKFFSNQLNMPFCIYI